MSEHIIVTLSEHDRDFLRRLFMALTQDLAASVTALGTAVDNLSARLPGSGPAAGFGVADTDVQAAITGVNAQIARLNNFLPSGNPSPTAPQIANVSPASGPIGSQITIAGSGFGAAQNNSTVKFNGVASVLDANTKWSDTQLIIDVPVGATTGGLMVNVNGQDSNVFAFTVA